MAFSVNTNNESMAALRLLGQTNRGLSQVQDRINSGFKVNGARDNASTFSIAQGMRGDVAALKAINEGLSMGIATTQVAVDAATQLSNKLIDLQAEVMKAQESTADRTKIQENVDKMVDDIQSIVDAAQFNGYNLLNGTDSDLVVTSSYNRTDPTTAAKATTTIEAEDLTTGTLSLAGLNVTSDTGTLTFGASWNANLADAQTLAITANGVTTTFEIVDSATDTLTAAGNVAVVMDYTATQGENAAVLMQAMRDQGFSVGYNDQGQVTISSSDGNVTAVTYSTADATGATVAGGSAATALTTVSTAMTTVNESLSRLAATANQLESQQDFVKSLADTLTSGVGALVDADLAEESARLQALQTKQQLGIQALSIANQGPGAVLSLFR